MSPWACREKGNCLKSAGPQSVEERNSPPFSGIEVYDNVNVTLTTGADYHLLLTGGKNLLPEVTTVISDTLLIIRNESRCNWMRKLGQRIHITVRAPEIRRIVHNGFGEIRTADTLKSAHIQITVFNYGTLSLSVVTGFLEMDTHGAPAIYLYGASGYAALWTSGNGWLWGEAMQCQSVSLTHGSTGDCFLNVSDDLNVAIENRGDVYYRGNPSSVVIVRNGEGKVEEVK